MIEADGGVGRRRPRLDLLVQSMGEAPVREALDVSGEDWESILSGGMELDETMLAHLETMTGAMGQAVEWWDEVEDEEAAGATWSSISRRTCPGSWRTGGASSRC